MFFLPLAQGTETAKATVGILQTVLSGGPLLILAVLVVVEAVVIWKLSGRLAGLEAEFRASSISLLQEQIRQNTPLTEALTKTNDVLGRVEHAMRENQDTMTRLNASLDAKERLGGSS